MNRKSEDLTGVTVCQTANGWVGIAWSERGLVALTLPEASEAAALSRLPAGSAQRPVATPGLDIAILCEKLQAYFEGDVVDLDEPLDESWRVILHELGMRPPLVQTGADSEKKERLCKLLSEAFLQDTTLVGLLRLLAWLAMRGACPALRRAPCCTRGERPRRGTRKRKRWDRRSPAPVRTVHRSLSDMSPRHSCVPHSNRHGF